MYKMNLFEVFLKMMDFIKFVREKKMEIICIDLSMIIRK